MKISFNVIIFSYIPMCGLILAFKNYQFNKGIIGSPWVGFTYFKAFFNDYQSGKLIRNTLAISSIKVFLGLPFPILLALMFNEVRNRRFRGITQSISYLPHFLSWVIVIGLMQRVFAPDTGLLNEAIRYFGRRRKHLFHDGKQILLSAHVRKPYLAKYRMGFNHLFVVSDRAHCMIKCINM
ncbi:hypothetical protein [Paenibacillus sp. yr247]|uniref:hypothetical protein n=1 Tax=Paenibacillus sp. yr247 TaxID=1761880 RepID=UPI0020C87930|nr:hypothetical protein [Paenibacillus sp. yr247]